MSGQSQRWPSYAWIALLVLAIGFLLPAMGLYLSPMVFWMLFTLVFLLFVVPGLFGPQNGASSHPAEDEEETEDSDDPAVETAVRDVMAVNGKKAAAGVLAYEGHLLSPAEDALRRLGSRLADSGRQVMVEAIGGGEARILVLPASALRGDASPPRLWLHGLLFAATFLTTTWAGALHQGVNLLAEPGRFSVGLPYALGLMLILGAHELGHYIAARRHG